MINPYIFREYDIRGIADIDLIDEVVELIGKSYASYIKGKEIIVGMDNRLSSERIKKSLVKGILSMGKDVIDIGLTISPILYYSRILYGIEGAIMITGSHNPGEYNGFKLCKGEFTMYGEQIKDLEKIIKAENFKETIKGKIYERDPFFQYEEMLKEKIKIDKKFKVIVDCGNGAIGKFAPKIIANWGCEVVPLYCELDGNFPNHLPDPAKKEALNDLIKKVKEENADLGFGFDGDGDRIGVVDEIGNIIWGDMLQILYQREILKKYPGSKAIIEMKCSQALYDDIVANGGSPIFWKTGHSLIKAKMLEENVLATGEMSGHIFFRDEYYGIDDALYAAGRILRIMSKSGNKLSQLLKDAPKYFATDEIRPYCPDEKKFEIISKIVNDFRDKYKIIDIDGARIILEDGWGLIRASNTQPALTVRAEGKSVEALDAIKKILENKLKEFNIELRWE
ncbi:MAG: phosphomannomutase/phosphoglucomutase [bacterium]